MNKTALITGASKGIGRAIAIEMARAGMNIAAVYNTSAKEALSLVESICATTGVRAIAVKADISDYACVETMFKEVCSVFPTVDVLVNNAGIPLVKTIMDTTAEDWRRVVDTNLSSVHYVTRLALPKMMDNAFGRVINISSIWGEIGASCEVAYSAAKAGVIGYTKALAKEVPPYITVNCIAPGIIDTAMNADLTSEEIEDFLKCVPASRMGSAEEVASLAAFLAGERSGYISGQVIGINGGMC